MAIDVSIEVDLHDDELVVVKTALSPTATARLQRERARLAAAQHPGVVELLGDHDPTPSTLTLSWAGGRSLETARPPLPDAIVLLGSVAATLADLHDVGVVHGRLDASHVVVERRRARLCGFAGPEPGEALPAEADDVAALGTLVALLAGPDSEAEPIPDHRFRRRRWDGYVRGALQTLADQATDPDPDRRPSARVLARSLAELEPEHTPTAAPGRRARPARRRPGRIPPAVVVASATVLALIGLMGATNRHAGPAPRRAAAVRTTATAKPHATTASDREPASRGAAPASSTSSTTSPKEPTTTATARRTTTDCTHITGAVADVDGDGCPDAVSIDGATITLASGLYRVGRPGDRVAVGDWDCDGTATPALVRPSSGEVFVFSGWARPGHPVSVTPAGTVAGAVAPVSRGSDCGPVRVLRHDGSITTVAKGR